MIKKLKNLLHPVTSLEETAIEWTYNMRPLPPIEYIDEMLSRASKKCVYTKVENE